MDPRNARNAGNADGNDDTLIDLESAVRNRISKLTDKARMHEDMGMNASSLAFRVNHQHEADVLKAQIRKLRSQLRGIRRGAPVYHDIFSIEPFTK